MKRRIGCCAAVRGAMLRATSAAPTASGTSLITRTTTSGFALCVCGEDSSPLFFYPFTLFMGVLGGDSPLTKIFFGKSSRPGRAAHSPPIHRRERCGGPSGINLRSRPVPFRQYIGGLWASQTLKRPALCRRPVRAGIAATRHLREGVRHFWKCLTPFMIREIFLDKKDNKLYFYISAQRK